MPRPNVGDRVRSKSQQEIVATVIGLKMNCVRIRYPSGNQGMWADGSYEIVPEPVTELEKQQTRTKLRNIATELLT